MDTEVEIEIGRRYRRNGDGVGAEVVDVDERGVCMLRCEDGRLLYTELDYFFDDFTTDSP